MDYSPILSTKLNIPPRRPGGDTVTRPRLYRSLDAGLNCKLTLISAPAGFGKTTLLSEWIAAAGLTCGDGYRLGLATIIFSAICSSTGSSSACSSTSPSCTAGQAPGSKAGDVATASNQNLVEPLTERELEVLQLLATSLSAAEIAGELVVAPSTVRTHIKRIFGKLGVHRRMEAVEKAKALALL